MEGMMKMVKSTLTEEKALDCYLGGIDCSQVTFGEFAEQLGIDKMTARKIASAFGGGLFHARTCGCVTGALMALGLACGYCEEGNEAAKNAFLAKKAEFEKRFEEENDSCICKELLGYDVSTPDGLAHIMEENLFQKRCAPYAVSACEIAADLMNE